MGKICAKLKAASRPASGKATEQKRLVVIRPPDKAGVFTRAQGGVGLKNLHNTCFANAVLQALAANNAFVGHLQNAEFLAEGTFTEGLQRFLR